MNTLHPTLAKFLTIIVAGLFFAPSLFLTGCVYDDVFAAFPFRRDAAIVDVNTYGTPAGYYYQKQPVYLYNGRTVYYRDGRRYPYVYHENHRHYVRNGFRYYY